MAWIRADYEFGGLFSYRIPDYPSPSYALSSPLPGPSTIKLAVVATAIETTGDIDFGEQIFYEIKNIPIRIGLPEKFSISNVLIKRLKKKKDEEKFENTFGIRGYLHMFEPLMIYFNMDNNETLKDILKKIRRIGTSDSIVSCINITEEDPAENSIKASTSMENNKRNVLPIPIKDISDSDQIRFEHVNPYSKIKNANVFVKKFYFIPIKKQIQGKNWIIYYTR